MSDAIAKELDALLALCRGTASVYRKLGQPHTAGVMDALGDRLAALLSDKR